MTVLIEARMDPRTRWRRLAPVAATGLAAFAALGYLAAFDPEQGGHYPACPTQALLGVDCPGCGGLRAAHALTRGDVVTAADHNLALFIMVPLAVLAYAVWAMRSWRGWSREVTYAAYRRRNRWLLIGVIALVVFGVIRNFVPYLGSGLLSG